MANYELNAKGLLCPMPVIKVQQKIQQLSKGDILMVYCTDPGAQFDLPAWCRVHGHTLLAVQQQPHEITISLRVG